jgi:hypothetical protein
MGQTIYGSEVLEDDYGDLPGMDRFRNDVASLPPAGPNFYAQWNGYEYQLAQTEVLHRQRQVRSVEQEYQGQSGVLRRADIETSTGDYIDCKAYASNYNPPAAEQQRFLLQAQDYAASGRRVTYHFRNDPPQWVKNILNPLALSWEIHP